MSLEELISNYGYIAVGIGTFFEGETVLVIGGFAAHRGYLDLPWVIFSAFAGTLFGDQLFFYMGRFKGKDILSFRPYWKAKYDKVSLLLEKNQNWLIIGFRFLYGLRTITPFLIGGSRISPVRFLILNTVGALGWAIIIGTLGFLFGHAFETVLGDIKHYELWMFGSVLLAGIILWITHFRKKKANVKAFNRMR